MMGDEAKEAAEVQEKSSRSSNRFFSVFSAKFMGRSSSPAPADSSAPAPGSGNSSSVSASASASSSDSGPAPAVNGPSELVISPPPVPSSSASSSGSASSVSASASASPAGSAAAHNGVQGDEQKANGSHSEGAGSAGVRAESAGAGSAGVGGVGGNKHSLNHHHELFASNVKQDPVALRFSQLKAESQLAVDKFQIRDTLGTGTFGRVRLVTYRHNGQDHHLALKMMKKSVVLQLKQVEHIRAERGILSKIRHPFIVNLLGTFQDEHRLFMIMEYVIGGELFSLLGNVGRLRHENAQFYAAEIALAFEYLHSQDIVYRDLKPENLLIDREGHMKIADFGFAKKLKAEDGYRTWTLCGTPEYLAPEIIQSRGHGKAVDWWALGILIYEMLAGYAPFYADEPYGIYRKILAGQIRFPSHFSPEAQDIVRQLCSADRSSRLGCGKDGALEVKRHPWFRGVAWEAMLRREVKVPYKPEVSSSDDTCNFDKYDEGDDGPFPSLSKEEQDLFKDF